MSKSTALFTKQLTEFQGDARLYKLHPPMKEEDVNELIEYVVVSAIVAMFTGPETYIFQSNQTGEITNWSELSGSHRGRLDHAAALKQAGYTIVKGD